MKPDLLVGGHSYVMDRPSAFIERYRRWAYAMRDAFREILAEEDYRYGYDPFWVRAEPYRVQVRRGEEVEVDVHVRNFRARPQAHRIEVHVPPGLGSEPGELKGELPAESRRPFRVRFRAAADARPGVHLVAFDVTLDGRRYGQWFDQIVEVIP